MMTPQPAGILVMGASYGLLPGAKLALAGHRVTLIGRSDEIAAMARVPVAVQIPSRRSGPDIVLTVPVGKQSAPGKLALATPDCFDPASFDLVILAMQEPQYRAPNVAGLMARIAAARLPCLSLMNLAPPPFLARMGVATMSALEGVYSSRSVWDRFDPLKFTLASPDPQAVRRDPAAPGDLKVTLASNFKAAPFALGEDQALLKRVASDMSHLEVGAGDAVVRPPVALVASSSMFVPLAKWPMLMAGNCRCVLPSGVQTIADAVLKDLNASEAIYEAVTALALRLGACPRDLVTFDAYLKAATLLTRPASLAKALEAGSPDVERVDLLIRNLMTAHDITTEAIDPIVDRIEVRLARNRSQIR